MIDERLQAEVVRQPHPLLFVTISGAHLYGFPSADSDYDLRGVHLLPAATVLGLDEPEETIEISKVENGLEFDLVTHDARKFFTLLLRRNGYVLEQLYSPLVVQTTPAHEELKVIGQECVTRHHAHHYLGFAQTQWRLFQKERPQRLKPLLYVFRVLLAGIYLMRSGRVESNLVNLNEIFGLPYLPELIERKVAGAEKGTLDSGDLSFYQAEYERLLQLLEEARDNTTLPEVPGAKPALSDLLVRLRLAGK
jgi:uncharacterized protein